METSTEDQQRRLKTGKRFGFLAMPLLFLSALFSSVDFSFLLIFGLSGIYCALMWFYFSHQGEPKRRSFEYADTGSSSWTSPSRNNALSSGRVVLWIVAGAMMVVFLIAMFVFTEDSAEENPTEQLGTSEENAPETGDYLSILQSNPNDIDALTNAGNSFYEDEGYDSALYYYDRVLRIDANNSPALYNKSLVLFNRKDFSGASALALRCIQIDPSNTDALMILGDCYQDQNNPDLALTQYNKAYELGARTPGLSNTLAYIYDTKGNTGKAISFYKETLAQDSARTDVYERLAALEPAKKMWYEKKAKEWKAK